MKKELLDANVKKETKQIEAVIKLLSELKESWAKLDSNPEKPREEKKGKKDYRPSRLAVRNCSKFLKDELLAAEPERILAMGKVPFQSLCDLFSIEAPKRVADFRKHIWWVRLGSREIPMSGTYFPGNNRHQGFDAIVKDIEKILELTPRSL